MADNSTDQQDKKQRILEVAAQLFAKKGFDGVSVREIAENAGVTKPVIYYYFKNKKALHEALIREAFLHTKQLHESIFQSDATVEQKLRMLMKSHFTFCMENPDIIQILYDAIHQRISDTLFMSPPSKQGPSHANFRGISEFVHLGQEQHIFREDVQPMKVGMLFIGAMNMFILYQLHSEHQVLSDELANELVDIILYGIMNHATRNQSSNQTEEASER